ncbi:YbaK/EbsC family protein [Nocardioides caldifontis]|uniref:YbaK/EbsC family protein n=1 Tax=Nocardioides caldifontis TaxID=2588938 RepID=UPI0011E017B3|nr:YbaK/EbsC family protein [Nocardioides caldifontis]
MTTLTIGGLTAVPALSRPDLLAEPVLTALTPWSDAEAVGVVEIDPSLADTAALTEAYDLPLEASGNCVVVGGRRDGVERVGACVVRADTRADVNNLVKRRLDVRKASFLSMDDAVARTGMEYGGITPVGLPAEWRLFVDQSLTSAPVVIIGSGLRRSKLLLPGEVLAVLPGAEVVADLGI